MRALFLCTDAYGGHGGIALFNREFCAALAQFPGCEEIVVVPRVIPRPGAYDDVPPRVTFVAGAAKNNAAYARTVAKVARDGAFDVVICGHVNLLPVARAASRHPLLITHGVEAWRRLKNPIANRILHDCRGIVSVSALTSRRLLAWSGYSGKTYVLPNAVRLGDYGIRPRNEEIVRRYHLDGKRVLLTVGRLDAGERSKGFDEVLELLPDLPADVVYMIAGGGNDAPRLQKKAGTLGVGDRVVFTGLFADEEKPDFYNLADAYVMPSRGEGFGFVFLEALASGTPVIASKHDGGREAILDGELGLLVDPSNPAEIRAAILELLARNEKRIPERLQYFAIERFVERVHAIVEDVL